MSHGQGSCTINLVGQKFGRLTITKWAGTDAQRGSKWAAKCECGAEVVVRRRNLVYGRNTLSCGCHRKDVQRIRLHQPNGSVKRQWVSVKALKAGLVTKA